MANDFNRFARRIRQIANGINEGVNDITKLAATRAQANVAAATPVDVGTARSNWIVRLGGGFRFVYRAYNPFRSRYASPPGPGGSINEGANLNSAMRQGAAVIARRKPDQDIYIVNNVPYIKRLDEGYSNQSPAGFVHRAVLEANQQTLSSALRILRRRIR